MREILGVMNRLAQECDKYSEIFIEELIMSINLDEKIKEFNKDYESNINAVKKSIKLYKSGVVEYRTV